MPAVNEQLARARPFVEALLDLTAGSQHADEVEGDLESVAELIRVNSDFATLIDTPAINDAAKGASLLRILGGKVNELTLRFVRALAEHRALGVLRVAAGQLGAEREARAGMVQVEAATAQPLGAAAREQVRARVAAMLGAPVILTERVDASLLSGLVLRVGDTLFDGSARSRLEQMRSQVIARGYHEIQSRRDLLTD